MPPLDVDRHRYSLGKEPGIGNRWWTVSGLANGRSIQYSKPRLGTYRQRGEKLLENWNSPRRPPPIPGNNHRTRHRNGHLPSTTMPKKLPWRASVLVYYVAVLNKWNLCKISKSLLLLFTTIIAFSSHLFLIINALFNHAFIIISFSTVEGAITLAYAIDSTIILHASSGVNCVLLFYNVQRFLPTYILLYPSVCHFPQQPLTFLMLRPFCRRRGSESLHFFLF